MIKLDCRVVVATWLTAFVCSLSVAHHTGAAETIELFNQRSLAGWKTMSGGKVGAGWEVTADGELHLDRSKGRAGHILSERDVDGDFELKFTWRVAKGGNSGIKYRVRKYGNQDLGCEFQLLDDKGHRNGRNPKTSAGALYGLFAPHADKQLRPVEEYNTSRIVVQGDNLQHWLNGAKVIDIVVGSPEWLAVRATDWSSRVRPAFRNTRRTMFRHDELL